MGSVPDDHGRSPVGHGRFMMSVPDVSPQFQSWVRHLRHARMPLRHLWAGSQCRRPVRASGRCRAWTGRLAVRHTGMPLKYLWAGSPCRGPTGIEERNRFEVAWKMLRHAVMPLRYLWVESPCRRPARRPLRHAEMSLEYLWAGFPCRRPASASVRNRFDTGSRQSCHARMPLRHLWKGSPCRSRLWEGLGWCSKQRPLWFARAGWGNRKRTAVAGDIFRKPPKKRKRLARQS